MNLAELLRQAAGTKVQKAPIKDIIRVGWGSWLRDCLPQRRRPDYKEIEQIDARSKATKTSAAVRLTVNT